MIVNSFYLFLCFLFATLSYGAPVEDNEKIVGGQNAPMYPWEVSLGSTQGVPPTVQERQAQSTQFKLGNHFCGGVLLTSNWVLTAAHCVVNDLTKDDPLPAASIAVGVGGYSLIEIYDRGRIPAAEIIIKKGYQSEALTQGNDIALIRLSQPVSNVRPACIAGRDVAQYPSPMAVIGWGNTQPLVHDQLTGQWQTWQPPYVLQQTLMVDVSRQRCAYRPDLICIDPAHPPSGPCKGDSGGSLFTTDYTVVGLTSFGQVYKIDQYRSRTCQGDAAYTRLSKYIYWIRQFVREPFCIR